MADPQTQPVAAPPSNRQAVIFLAVLTLGLYPIWAHSRWTTKTKWIWTAAWAGLLGTALVVSFREDQAARRAVEEANQLWQSGNKAEAVTKYRSVLDKRLSVIGKPERPEVLQRIVEVEVEKGNTAEAVLSKYLRIVDEADQPAVFRHAIETEAEKGNPAEARKLIEQALGKKTTLSLKTQKANDLLAEVKAQREAEVKRKQEEEETARQRREEERKKRAEEDRLAELRREKERQERPDTTKAAKKEPDKPIAVNAVSLLQEYEANEVAADLKYKEKLLEINGVVQHVGKDVLDVIYVALKAQSEFDIFCVQCFFDDKHTEQTARLKKGQLVTIRGRCDGKFGNVLIKRCEILKQ